MNQPAPPPRRGQIWEVIDGCDVHVQYLFNAPITFDGPGKLPAREQVRILTENTGTPPEIISFLPVRYAELHDQLVPPDIRDTPRYKKYMLSVKTGYFHEHFRLVGDDRGVHG